MRKWILLLVGVVLGCDNDNVVVQPASVTQLSDGQVLEALTTSNKGEADAGSLAAVRGTNPAVIAFGQQMVADHGAALQRLSAIMGITPMDSDLNQNFAIGSENFILQLQTAVGGSKFDLTYMCGELREHTAVINAMDTQMTAIQDPQLNAEVNTERLMERQHLATSQSILRSVGGANFAATCAGFGGTPVPTMSSNTTSQTALNRGVLPGSRARVPMTRPTSP